MQDAGTGRAEREDAGTQVDAGTQEDIQNAKTAEPVGTQVNAAGKSGTKMQNQDAERRKSGTRRPRTRMRTAKPQDMANASDGDPGRGNARKNTERAKIWWNP